MPALYKNIFFFSYALVYLFVVALVFISNDSAYSQTLYWATQEGGVFEWGSVILLALVSVSSFIIASSEQIRPYRIFKVALNVLGFVAILAILEEVSWGQHIWGFESAEVFKEHNRQGETNLHNFIHPVIFTLTQNLSIYCFFIYVPLLFLIKPNVFPEQLFGLPLIVFMPSLHNILIFCYATTMQAYFLFDTLADTGMLFIALGMIFYLLVKHKSYGGFFTFHWLAVVLSSCVLMFNFTVLSFENMQYEIREMMIVFGLLYWLLESHNRLKSLAEA